MDMAHELVEIVKNNIALVIILLLNVVIYAANWHVRKLIRDDIEVAADILEEFNQQAIEVKGMFEALYFEDPPIMETKTKPKLTLIKGSKNDRTNGNEN